MSAELTKLSKQIWYQQNRDTILQQKREYYQQNKEARKTYQNEYYRSKQQ